MNPSHQNTLKNEGISTGMLKALDDVYSKQKARKPISLREIAGSKGALIARELLEFSTVYINRQPLDTWRLTKKGISLLRFIKNSTNSLSI